MIEYAVAVRRAVNGEIEGVCSASGRLRYVRELTAVAREVIQETKGSQVRSKPQPMNAITNLGAYRQHLETGTVWALCMCRGMDGAK